MRSLISAMGRSLNALANLTFILAIILYMFAVVGTQLFSDQYSALNITSQEVPDWNFNNFGHSFLVIFRILCGEWIELLYECMRVTGNWTPLFFIAALIIGNFLILNLFLALLLGSFAEQSYEEEVRNRTTWKAKVKWTNLSSKVNKIICAFRPSQKVAPLAMDSKEESVEKQVKPTNGTTDSAAKRWVRFANVKHSSESASSAGSFSSTTSVSKLHSNEPKWSCFRSNERKWSCFLCCSCLPSFQTIKKKVEEGWTSMRNGAKIIKDNKVFDYFIIVIIIMSSLILVFEDIHLPKKPTLSKALEVLNIVFCLLFVMELLLKILAMGVVMYAKNGWNVLDFIIVTASVVSVFTLSSNFKTVRSIRTLRALRPLQAVSRWNGIKIIVNSLVRAIPSIANVVLVCLMFWLIFSILGVQFFGGKFFKCLDHHGDRIDAVIIPNRSLCLYQNLTWKNSAINFDNALNGFLALFQVATFEGWIEIIRDAVDATEIDEQPVKQSNKYAYIYFIIFVIIGSFVILNLFISVMIDNFYALKKQQDDYGSLKIYLSRTQKMWLSTVKKSVTKKPMQIMKRPVNRYLGCLFDMLCSAPFETLVMVLIFSNLFIMMMEHHEQPIEFHDTLLATNILFTVIFAIEILLKIIAFRQYFYIHLWNIYDLIIIILSVTELILHYYEVDLYVTPSLFRVSRVLRIGRLLRYFNEAKGIRRLLLVLMNSSASVFHMGILLFLLLFIYSVMGMTNFGHVKQTGSLNEIVNFETFGSSMLLLLRISTSAGWNEVLDALMVEPPDCRSEAAAAASGGSADCPNVIIAVLYFVTYILFSFLVVVNMHIAIILENFNEAYQEGESGITDEDLEMYYAVWQWYDPMATQYVAFEKVPYLVANLGPPLGMCFPNKIAVYNLNIPVNMDDKVHCNNLLQGLIEHFYAQKDDEEIANTELYGIIEKKGHAAFPILTKDVVKTTSMELLKRDISAAIIQRFYRKYRSKLPPSAQSKQEIRTSSNSSRSPSPYNFVSITDISEYRSYDGGNGAIETTKELLQIENITPTKQRYIDTHTIDAIDVSKTNDEDDLSLRSFKNNETSSPPARTGTSPPAARTANGFHRIDVEQLSRSELSDISSRSSTLVVSNSPILSISSNESKNPSSNDSRNPFRSLTPIRSHSLSQSNSSNHSNCKPRHSNTSTRSNDLLEIVDRASINGPSPNADLVTKVTV